MMLVNFKTALRVIACMLFLVSCFAGVGTLFVSTLKADIIGYAKWQHNNSLFIEADRLSRR